MKLLILLFLNLSILLFSCQKETDTTEPIVPKVEARECPIVYTLDGDTIRIEREYVSEWEIDPQTLERIPLAYTKLPTLSYAINSYRDLNGYIDSINHAMLNAGVITEIPAAKINFPDTLHFQSVYHFFFKPVMHDLRRNGVATVYPHIKNKYVIWKDLKLNVKPGKHGAEVSIYFYNGIPRLRIYSDDTTFDAKLTEKNARDIITLYKPDSKIAPKKDSSDKIGVLVATNNEMVTAKEMYAALTLLDVNSMWFQFTFDPFEFKPVDTLNYKKHKRSRLYGGKPIIYLYPEERTDVSIKIDTSVDFTFTYPKYREEGWQVTADPDGTISDYTTGKRYYSLFWEGMIHYRFNFPDGFVVHCDKVVSFLEEKLKVVGLNFREAQEFILFWGPILEQNEYSLIHFATEEYAKAVPLTITPKPDTEIRVLMNFMSVDSSYKIEEQKLTPVKRSGFTLVEWGGSNYDKDTSVK